VGSAGRWAIVTAWKLPRRALPCAVLAARVGYRGSSRNSSRPVGVAAYASVLQPVLERVIAYAGDSPRIQAISRSWMEFPLLAQLG